jgi:hypothetical protein
METRVFWKFPQAGIMVTYLDFVSMFLHSVSQMMPCKNATSGDNTGNVTKSTKLTSWPFLSKWTTVAGMKSQRGFNRATALLFTIVVHPVKLPASENA